MQTEPSPRGPQAPSPAFSAVQTPGARSELKRALNRYNLTVGFGAAFTLALLSIFAMRLEGFSLLFGETALDQGVMIGIAAFLLITLLHTTVHVFFGWRFGRGLTAARSGDYAKAARLLRFRRRRGAEHYDPENHALNALTRLDRGDLAITAHVGE